MLSKSKESQALSQNKVDINICKRFKEIRKARRLTQPEFAAELNTTRVSVNAIEHFRYNPGIDLIRAIRERYKISYDYLLDGK